MHQTWDGHIQPRGSFGVSPQNPIQATYQELGTISHVIVFSRVRCATQGNSVGDAGINEHRSIASKYVDLTKYPPVQLACYRPGCKIIPLTDL